MLPTASICNKLSFSKKPTSKSTDYSIFQRFLLYVCSKGLLFRLVGDSWWPNSQVWILVRSCPMDNLKWPQILHNSYSSCINLWYEIHTNISYKDFLFKIHILSGGYKNMTKSQNCPQQKTKKLSQTKLAAPYRNGPPDSRTMTSHGFALLPLLQCKFTGQS